MEEREDWKRSGEEMTIVIGKEGLMKIQGERSSMKERIGNFCKGWFVRRVRAGFRKCKDKQDQ